MNAPSCGFSPPPIQAPSDLFAQLESRLLGSDVDVTLADRLRPLMSDSPEGWYPWVTRFIEVHQDSFCQELERLGGQVIERPLSHIAELRRQSTETPHPPWLQRLQALLTGPEDGPTWLAAGSIREVIVPTEPLLRLWLNRSSLQQLPLGEASQLVRMRWFCFVIMRMLGTWMGLRFDERGDGRSANHYLCEASEESVTLRMLPPQLPLSALSFVGEDPWGLHLDVDLNTLDEVRDMVANRRRPLLLSVARSRIHQFDGMYPLLAIWHDLAHAYQCAHVPRDVLPGLLVIHDTAISVGREFSNPPFVDDIREVLLEGSGVREPDVEKQYRGAFRTIRHYLRLYVTRSRQREQAVETISQFAAQLRAALRTALDGVEHCDLARDAMKQELMDLGQPTSAIWR